MRIAVLPEEVVAQIAAGEVVERPASVVKELLENAIDAGARQIRVAINGDGRTRIVVADDGSGIHTEEVETAFMRHATSKLRALDDLNRLQTLGFRGEALASIAAVSRVTLVTRHIDEQAGTRMLVEGGHLRERKSIGAPAGTVLTIENLFFNTPARLKFLKSENTEKRQITAVISRYSMAYPDVRAVLEQDGREIFRTHGSGFLGDVITSALGLEHGKQMVAVDNGEGERIRVYGYTSAPSLNRADRSRITLFVNGRWIVDNSLTYAVIQAYHTLLMTGRYPVAVLMIQVPPEDVDVNVHPTKAEVRFRDGDAVFAAIQKAVRRAVIEQAQTPGIFAGRFNASDSGARSWGDRYEAAQLDLSFDLIEPGQHARKQHVETASPDENDPTAIPYGPGAPLKPRTLPLLRVIGQVAASYIVAEGPAGLYLVDQHAAHERILYEQFMDEHARQGMIAQFALAAQTLHVSPDEARLLEDNLESLQAFGFEIEPFGPNAFVVRSVPAMLADRDPATVIGGILEDLYQGNKPGQARIEDKIVIRVCKQAAVKAGQILSLEQMQGLIRQLERCDSPLTCPHGRPTMIHMSSDQLEREFGRTGV
ncbi:MAG: DNA mismatch repair endonuclease MutL [Anaerolineae bacterium]|nr:DNA mismatch repair endonuclease MutL [Anaerolineae bacterium]